MTTIERSTFDALELAAVVLGECEVTRGDGDVTEPGKVESSFEIELSLGQDATYVVQSSHKFSDPSNETVAVINVSFVATYEIADGVNLPKEQLEEFGRRVVIGHVIPFIREFMATMTNRLGLVPFYMPLFRTNRSRSNPVDSQTDSAPPESGATAPVQSRSRRSRRQ